MALQALLIQGVAVVVVKQDFLMQDLLVMVVMAVLVLLLFATHLQLLNILVELLQRLVEIKFIPLHHQAY
jgi:hypothetical protein